MRKLSLSLAILAALVPGSTYPLGLGDIQLNSALNQELDAEIPVLSAEPEDAQSLIVRLADRDAFARAGIDRPYLLQQLKFKAEVKNGKPYVKVYTMKPIREPFLSFLLEVDWPEGHLLREYTVLLDPPVYNTGGSGGASTTPADTGGSRPFNDASAPEQKPMQSQMADSRPAQSAMTAPAPSVGASSTAPSPAPAGSVASDNGQQMQYRAMPEYRQVSGEYRVQQNDTLWSLANKFRPDSSVSVEQMMLALVRENPEAFIKENVNGIKRGYILRMPDRNSITSIDRQQALAEVRRHASLWREYRQSLTGAAPASSLSAAESGGAAGETAETAHGEGKLSIVSPEGQEGGASADSAQDPQAEIQRLKQKLALAQEQLESEKLEKNNLQERLTDLEQRVKSAIQMGVNDSELAKLQSDLSDARQQAAEQQPAETTPETPAAENETPAPETEAAAPEETAPTEPETATTEAPAEQPADTGTEEQPVFADEAAGEATKPAEEAPATAETPPASKPVTPPPFAQTTQKGFLEQLMENPNMLMAVGGGAILILLLVALLLRRRRAAAESDEDWMALDESDLQAEAESDDLDTVVAPHAEEATSDMPPMDEADHDATAEMETARMGDTAIEAPGDSELEDTVISLADESTEAEQEEERDDVIAEADVYLAYGIYQQAEELLQNAIRENPERDDYRMKLLETYFAGKNADAFESLADETYKRKGDDKSFWDRVVVMGRELCPAAELFSSADTVAMPSDLSAEDIIPQKPETTDLELDAGDTETTDFDLGLDETPAEEETDATMVLSEPVDLEAPAGDDTAMDLESELEAFSSEAETTTPGEAESEDAGLEFDLGDFDTGEAAAPATAETEEESDDLGIDEDFSLDFDASDLGFETTDETEETAETAEATPALEEAATEEEPSLDLDADLDLSVDLDEGETDFGLAEETPETETALDEAEDMGLDLDMGLAEETPAAEAEDMLDLSDSGLEAGASEDEDFDISELSEDIDEVSTKLDLAKAYMDMGDNEGARSILEEVKQEGNPAQIEEAEALLQKAS